MKTLCLLVTPEYLYYHFNIILDGPDALIDALMQAQGRRMDEQRANIFPGLQGNEDLMKKFHEYVILNC